MEVNKNPLCVFCLSPSFAVLPYRSSTLLAPRRPRIAGWRRGGSSNPRIRPRFKPDLRCGASAIQKYLAARVRNHRREIYNLQEVLNTIREVWLTPKNDNSPLPTTSVAMDERRKISCATPSEVSSPVLLRRRLSAPETVMRKHSLAQQRSDSQDGDMPQTSDYRNYPWNVDVGSDSNLSRRKDSGFMRKSMLMRRFLNNGRSPNEKSKRFYGAYSDWQYSTGKLSAGRSSYSLNSNHSSPEHIKSFRSLTGEEFKSSQSSSSPLKGSRKVSPKHMYNLHSSPRRKMSVYNNNYQGAINSNTFRTSNSVESSASLRTTTTENRLTTTETIKTTETESDTTTTTRRTGTYATSFSDNSDSAYTNSQSNFTRTSNSETYYSQTQASTRDEEQNDSNDNTFRLETSASNNNSTGVPDPEKRHESSTQTPDTANLNVISNVQLSQSTLNLIFNQVLQDVQNKQPNSINIKTLSATLPPDDVQQIANDAKVINVQQMPSFYLNCKEDVVITPEHNRIIKYMISNIGTGSPYSKPAEIPQVVVPRYSALPRTSSMEVNTSSDDSTDKESDTVSLVDSLEDPMTPKGGQNYDDKLVRGDLSILLPDNSDKKMTKAPQKPAVFFIPIENVKHDDFKAVSELLPAKVREKLSKRQQKREQKFQQSKNNFTSPRSDSNYISASDNQISFTVKNNLKSVDVQSIPTLPDINSHKRRMNKPSMQNIRKIKMESKDNLRYSEFDRLSKPLKRKSITKYEKGDASSSGKSKSSTQKSPQKSPTKLSPLYSPKDEYHYDVLPRRIYQKTEVESPKRIEILEIMECVDDAEKLKNCLKTSKSKIPVLVHQKLPKIDKKPLKPVFIEFGHVLDPKMDQLIANILIDTLNKCDESQCSSSESSNLAKDDNNTKCKSKYQQFEAIPEEMSLHSSMEDSITKSDKSNANNILIEETANIMTNQVLKSSNIQESLSNNNKTPNNNLLNDGVSPKEDTSTSETNNLKGLPKKESMTIPHGWITFYMLHKNNGSPDSTSDEGTNSSVKAKPNIEQCFRKKDLQPKSNDKENSSVKMCENLAVAKKERSNTLDMVSSSDAFSDTLNSARNIGNIGRKKHLLNKRTTRDNCRNRSSKLPKRNITNGWSVTVSGTNTYGQYAPDVEMRLKFPTPRQGSEDDKQSTERNEEHVGCNNFFHGMDSSCHLPKRHHNQQQKSDSVIDVATTEDTYRNGRLPVIHQKTNLKVSESWDSSITSSMIPLRMEPRQTKTSTRRLALNRPRTLQPVQSVFTTENFLKLSAERQLAAILHKFPGILSINGNSINPEPKSCLNTERNLPRSLYTNPR